LLFAFAKHDPYKSVPARLLLAQPYGDEAMLQYRTFDRFTTHPASDAESVAMPVAAGILGVASKAVHHMALSDHPPCVRIGGCVLSQRDGPDAKTRGETA
jgi:hypothetical protein